MVEFDPVSHTYRDGGTALLNVTSVLKTAGIVDDRFYNTWARDRGSAVHKAIHFYEDGDLDEASVDPVVKPYFHAYLRFRDEMVHWKLAFHEKIVVNSGLGYAGTIDAGYNDGPRLHIVDYKTGELSRPVGLQLTGYALALWEQDKIMPRRLYGVQLNDDGSYKMAIYPIDIGTWLGAVTVANWIRG
jgi:hypothetical protein